ncbi:MAG: MBL fold metallo-hydrolase [Candidatus Gracilibacteria bacterium]|jgi:L-ascorbate metabolism protein UlaG (beta-lactamase superfamily)
MEITWLGKTAILLKDKGVSALIDPDPKAEDTKEDIILKTQGGTDKDDEKYAGKVFSWPGEYEVKDIQIAAYQTWTKSKSKEDEGEKAKENLIFTLDFNGIKICHLGNLGHILSSDLVNEIGDVDVLIIPLGESSNLNTKKALEIVESIEPRVIIPMMDEAPVKYLKELGASEVEEMEKFVLKARSELPEDKRRHILLTVAK